MSFRVNTYKQSLASKLFDIFNYTLLIIVSLAAVLPFVYILVASITPPDILAKELFILVPKGFTMESYRYVFSTGTIPRSLLVTVFITIFGTIFRLGMTILFAYPLSHKFIKGRNYILFLVTFTMMFSGGIIPGYMVVRNLRLIDSYWALILPGAINTFNFVIFRNYFQNIPFELEESAKIDGAGYFSILVRIVLPVSLPMIATFVIMYGVEIWNAWFNATMYLNDSSKWPIQVILRQIVNMSMNVGSASAIDSDVVIPQANIRMCTIAVSTLPILMIYPFFQRFFMKGLLLGAIKG